MSLEKLNEDENVVLSRCNDQIHINIKNTKKLAFVNYTDELIEIIKAAKFRIPSSTERIKEYKYPYSNAYNKTLHQIVFDYYFGEETRKDLYEKDYIIEHLDNNGFNCDISNLFVLKKVKNTYKGWNFDKEVQEAKPIIALRIYHIITNRTFQIVIAFNKAFCSEKTKKTLSTVKLLYNYNYEIVLQDAEQILETILNTGKINFNKWRELYRFNDIDIEYDPEIELSDQEKMQSPGTLIFRDGKAMLLIGQNENGIGLIDSVGFKMEWNLKADTQR